MTITLSETTIGVNSTPIGTRTYRLVVAPAGVLSMDAVTSVDPTTGDTIVEDAANAPSNDTQTGLDLSELDFKFKIKRTLKSKPNTAVIMVYGLGDNSRLYLSTPKKLSVSLEAGYDDDNELLFLGETRNSYSLQDTAENVTVIETGDSAKVMQAAGLALTWGSVAINIQHAAAAIQATLPGLISNSQLQNWAKASAALSFANPLVLHPKGGAVDRKSVKYLDDICRSAGLEWSVQNGVVLILPKGQPLSNQQLIISETSGMIGSPSVDNNGFLDVKCLLMKGLHPGALITVQAKNVQGDYRIESAEAEGGNGAGHREWYMKLLCSNPKNSPGQKLGFS